MSVTVRRVPSNALEAPGEGEEGFVNSAEAGRFPGGGGTYGASKGREVGTLS